MRRRAPSRVQGLVIARGARDALVVLPRDGAVAGVGIADGAGWIVSHRGTL